MSDEDTYYALKDIASEISGLHGAITDSAGWGGPLTDSAIGLRTFIEADTNRRAILLLRERIVQLFLHEDDGQPLEYPISTLDDMVRWHRAFVVERRRFGYGNRPRCVLIVDTEAV